MRFDRKDCDVCTHRYVCGVREDYESIYVEPEKVDEFVKPFLDKLNPCHVLMINCLQFERDEEEE